MKTGRRVVSGVLLTRPPYMGPCAGQHVDVVLIVRYGPYATSTLCEACQAKLARNGGTG